MNFNDIIGQKEVIDKLKNSIDRDKIGHAYVFVGPRGIGKRTVANCFASILLCGNGRPSGSCGECLPCQMVETSTNPDFHILEPEDTSIGVDEIRDMQSDIVVRPLYSPKKVYIIADADKMTVQAQNCLLKTLEEPPPYAVIILTASSYEALMETIRSRTVKYSFKRNSPEEIRRLLERRFDNASADLDFIASYCDGVIGRALELVESDQFSSMRMETIDRVLRLAKSKLVDIFEIGDFFEANKTSINSILDIMLLFYRDILVAKMAGKENMLINSDKSDIILVNADNFLVQKLIRNMEAIETARKNIKQNANYQLSIEVMLMTLQEEDA